MQREVRMQQGAGTRREPATQREPRRHRYDVVVVGGGHNGLAAAAYLARAGLDVCLLERSASLGGATTSGTPFPGVGARLSRYSYLVSLLPRLVLDELGLDLRLIRRRVSSYTPDPRTGGRRGLLLPGAADPPGLADADDGAAGLDGAFERLGADDDAAGWRRWQDRVGALAARVWPTLTEPLRPAAEMRRLVGDDELWEALVETPVGVTVGQTLRDDVARGVLLTDALIGTFADPQQDLRANRCLLYHVVGGGTGQWDVPVGGMGAVSGALAAAAASAGAELVTRARVVGLDPGDERPGPVGRAAEVVVELDGPAARELRLGADRVVWAAAPAALEEAIGTGENPGAGTPERSPAPEGSQLKVNLVLSRLPRLRDRAVRAEDAFAGTFHVNESESQLAAAHTAALAGRLPDVLPCEAYCHTLSDPTILSPELQRRGVHTMTVFGLHTPARLFRDDPEGSRDAALGRVLASLDSVLAEPVEECLLADAAGRPCIEVRTPVDLEADLGLPGGHIFHRDLQWPWAEDDADAGRWGGETGHARVVLGGAGARRGGGVSAIAGRAAAMVVLGR